MSQIIYFDNAATTPIDPRVQDAMITIMRDVYGNPASRSHAMGWEAEAVVERARADIAALIGADPKEIVFTSGATESNNLALKGAAHFYRDKGQHIITVETEHKCVIDTVRELQQQGFEVTFLGVKSDGRIDLEDLKKALRPDTILVSVMHANNETGVLQDLAAIGALCREKGVLFHSDAAQSCGKVAIDVQSMHIDMMSISAHKMYGPKGIGALYVRRKPRVRLKPLIHGGGHERGMRSGTLATHQIAGFGCAAAIAKAEQERDAAHCLLLKNRLLEGLSVLEATQVNGTLEHMLPGHLNISFNYIEGESLMMALKGLAVSSGSACTSASLEPSYVLRALGLADELAHSSIRFSVGRFNTSEEVEQVISLVKKAVEKLRKLSPLWEMVQEGIDLNSVKWQEH